jgi:hypothetical protein
MIFDLLQNGNERRLIATETIEKFIDFILKRNAMSSQSFIGGVFL